MRGKFLGEVRFGTTRDQVEKGGVFSLTIDQSFLS